MHPSFFWYLGAFTYTGSLFATSTSSKTVTPAQPANFLFKIESDVGQGAERIDILSVRLVYPGG